MPIEGMDRQEYLEKKFGNKVKAKKIYQDINDEGLANNIYFQFDKILKTPNSFASHKILALAHLSNKQTEVVETLFYNYFIEGTDIGDIKKLIQVAKLHNIYNNDTLDYLNSDIDKKSLLSEEKYARQMGIKGVPCFIVNKEFVLVGAQDKNKFIDIFKRIFNGN